MKKEELLKVIYRTDRQRINKNDDMKLKSGYLHQWVMGEYSAYGMIITDDGNIERIYYKCIKVDWGE